MPQAICYLYLPKRRYWNCCCCVYSPRGWLQISSTENPTVPLPLALGSEDLVPLLPGFLSWALLLSTLPAQLVGKAQPQGLEFNSR